MTIENFYKSLSDALETKGVNLKKISFAVTMSAPFVVFCPDVVAFEGGDETKLYSVQSPFLELYTSPKDKETVSFLTDLLTSWELLSEVSELGYIEESGYCMTVFTLTEFIKKI